MTAYCSRPWILNDRRLLRANASDCGDGAKRATCRCFQTYLKINTPVLSQRESYLGWGSALRDSFFRPKHNWQKATKMPYNEDTLFLITCYVCTAVVLLGFGSAAVYLTRSHGAGDTLTFITARHTQPTLRVAWSFYASSVGAWAVFLPASFTSIGGWVSIISYAVATGLPLLCIAEWGARILQRCPDVCSLNDFAYRRYGRVVQLFVIILSLVNMSVALVAEYTAIGDLFELYVGGERVGIIVLVGTVTAIYTAAGGLLVSILTDQGQAIMSLVLIVVAAIFLACDFRAPPNGGALPPNLGVNRTGLSSIFSLPISVTTAAVFSEAFWQRVWAAENPQSLRRGSILGFLITTLVIGFFGLVGWLGQWAGLQPLPGDVHNNLVFFVPFSHTRHHGTTWVRVLLLILAAVMNESAVDSLQNAVVSTLSSTLLVNRPVMWSRVAVFLINAPLVAVALQGYSLLDLFLIMNIMTTCAAFPLLSGLWLQEVSSFTVIGSFIASILCTCLLGWCVSGGSLADGLKWTFSSAENGYDYRLFLVGFLVSMGAVWLGWAVIDRPLSRRKGGNGVEGLCESLVLRLLSPRRPNRNEHVLLVNPVTACSTTDRLDSRC